MKFCYTTKPRKKVKQKAAENIQATEIQNVFISLQPFSGLVAQWIEQQPSKLRVIGSNPIGVTLK